MSKLIPFATAIIFCFLFTDFTTGQEDQEKVLRVAVVGPITTKDRTFGIPHLQGIKHVLERTNKKGTN